jgi:transposase InsO family protein
MDQARSSQRYQGRPAGDEARLLARILELVRRHPRYGYRMITAKLRQEGWSVNAKRVYRIWRREGLKVPQKKRKKKRLGSSENACHRRRATRMNDVWCWDFIFDHTTNGTQLKWLSVVDEYTRENLCLKVDRSITSEDVLDTLAELFAMYGVPNHIRSDNGPEFIANAIRTWVGQLGVNTMYIEPGSPWENGYAESFHSRFRDEFLATEEFENLRSAQRLTSRWRNEYNNERPHSSLNYLTPAQYAASQPQLELDKRGAAPPTSAVTSTSEPSVKAEATAKANGAQGNHIETFTFLTQTELS